MVSENSVSVSDVPATNYTNIAKMFGGSGGGIEQR